MKEYGGGSKDQRCWRLLLGVPLKRRTIIKILNSQGLNSSLRVLRRAWLLLKTVPRKGLGTFVWVTAHVYSGDLLQDDEQHDCTETAVYSTILSSKALVFGENGFPISSIAQ